MSGINGFGGWTMSRHLRGRLTLPVAIATLPMVAFGATAAAQQQVPAPQLVSPAAPAPRAANSAAVAQLQTLSDAFATVAARVRPSVVFITSKQAPRTVAQPRGQQPGQRRGAPNIPGLPPELRRFFDTPGMPDGPDGPRGGGTAAGSGFVVSADGYVL